MIFLDHLLHLAGIDIDHDVVRHDVPDSLEVQLQHAVASETGHDTVEVGVARDESGEVVVLVRVAGEVRLHRRPHRGPVGVSSRPFGEDAVG